MPKAAEILAARCPGADMGQLFVLVWHFSVVVGRVRLFQNFVWLMHGTMYSIVQCIPLPDFIDCRGPATREVKQALSREFGCSVQQITTLAQ